MKRNLGQLLLIVGVGLILLSAASNWFGWFGSTVTPIVFILAMVLTVAGRLLTALSRRQEKE